jgi:hypothetical protein
MRLAIIANVFVDGHLLFPLQIIHARKEYHKATASGEPEAVGKISDRNAG